MDQLINRHNIDIYLDANEHKLTFNDTIHYLNIIYLFIQRLKVVE